MPHRSKGQTMTAREGRLMHILFAIAACGQPATHRPSSPAPAPAAPAAPALPSGPQLFTGLSNHRHLISTSSREAQQFFDQGVKLVFAFNHEEAASSFRHAATL